MIPLNARRLMQPMLRQIGEALGVPSSSSDACAELKLMVEESWDMIRRTFR